MDINISFSDFMDVKSYCKLQSQFLFYDYSQWHDEVKEPFSDNKIIYRHHDIMADEEDYQEKYFIKDYLKPGIDKLSKLHFSRFKNKISKNNLFSDELQNGLAKVYINKINKTKSVIKEAKYLSIGIKVLLNRELKKLEYKIETFLKDPYPNISNKLKFNWIRTDVIYFFHLLRINKQIKMITDGDLGRIIDTVIECKNSDNEYTEIFNSRKHLTAFKNLEGRGANFANDRLKNIFKNEDFYNI